jgi:hypothetical protein
MPTRPRAAALTAALALSGAAPAQSPAPPTTPADPGVPITITPPTAPAAPAPPGARTSPAAPRFVLIRPAAEPQTVSLLALSIGERTPAQVTYLDAAGERRTEPLSGVVALAPLAWLDPPAEPIALLSAELPLQRLDLVDGQRLVGRIAPDPDDPPATAKDAETVRFTHDRLGALAVPLDRVRRFSAEPRRVGDLSHEDLSGPADVVLLANGDRLEGLVARLGPAVAVDCEPVVRPGSRPGAAPRPEPVSVDIDQVLVARLVNPPARMTGARVELADASVLAATTVHAAADAAQLAVLPALAPAGSPPAPLPLSDLAGVVPDASRVVALASLPIAAQERAPGRLPGPGASVVSEEDAPLGAADILVPGPMRVEWELPKGATRLLGQLRLDESAMAWGDCTVVLSVAPSGGTAPDREIARAALNSGNPAAPVAADLPPWKPGDRLRLRVQSGPRGPIQDRVLLRRALILQDAAK